MEDTGAGSPLGGNFRGPRQKTIHVTEKKGINLAQYEKKHSSAPAIIIGVLVIAALGVGVARFGVMAGLQREQEAQDLYNETHQNYIQVEEAAAEYDSVLREYRSCSMEWMENDATGQYTSADCTTVMDLVEQKIMPLSTVVSYSIGRDTLTVEMYEMDLRQISEMFAQLEDDPLVASCTLQVTQSDDSASEAASEAEEQTEDGTPSPTKEQPATMTIFIALRNGTEETVQ